MATTRSSAGFGGRGAQLATSPASKRRVAEAAADERIVADDAEAGYDGRDGFFVLSASSDLGEGLGSFDVEAAHGGVLFDADVIGSGAWNEQPQDFNRIRTRQVWSPCQSVTDSPSAPTSTAMGGGAPGAVAGFAASQRQSPSGCGLSGHLDLPPLVRRLLRPRAASDVWKSCEATVSLPLLLPPRGPRSGACDNRAAADDVANVGATCDSKAIAAKERAVAAAV